MPKYRTNGKSSGRGRGNRRSIMRSFVRDERGNVIMWVCFVLLTMLFISAFAVDLVHAMDRATHSSTRIVVRPFGRSLQDTAHGDADFHMPLIQDTSVPPPKGLAYVMDADFGDVHFVVYSRKTQPFDSHNIGTAQGVEIEPGHDAFFAFPVEVTHCVPCSLDKVLSGHADALVVASDIVDPLLHDPKYRGIHRALYKSYPVRALVPVAKDSKAARAYLAEGTARLKKSGEMWTITHHDQPYADWQP